MAADGLPPIPVIIPAEPETGGWLLRELALGERVVLGDAIVLELRLSSRGRPRIAIKAPRAVRIVWPSKAT